MCKVLMIFAYTAVQLLWIDITFTLKHISICLMHWNKASPITSLLPTLSWYNEGVMRCIKHSMMFEAQMTAVSQYSMFPEEKKERAECREKEEEEERTSPVFECGDSGPV